LCQALKREIAAILPQPSYIWLEELHLFFAVFVFIEIIGVPKRPVFSRQNGSVSY
jgi:hypothetical protein